jgi:hypothetical protein
MHVTSNKRGTVLVTAALTLALTTSLTVPRVVATAADTAAGEVAGGPSTCIPLDPSTPAQAAELEVIQQDGVTLVCPPAVGGSTPGITGDDALSGDDALPASTASDQPAPGTQPSGDATATEGAPPTGADVVVPQVQAGGTTQDAVSTPPPPPAAASIEAATAPDQAQPTAPDQAQPTAPDQAQPSAPQAPVVSMMSTDQGGTTGGARDPDPEPRLDDYGGDTGRWIADHDAWMRRRVDRAYEEATAANGGRWPPPNEDAARLNIEPEPAPAPAPQPPVMALRDDAGSGSSEWVPDPARPGVEWGPGGRPRWTGEHPPGLPDAGFDPELYGQLRDSWRRGVAERARQRERAPDDEQSGSQQAQIVTGPLPQAGPAPVAAPRGQAQQRALGPMTVGTVAGAGGAAIGGYLLWRLLSRSPCLVGGPGLYAVCQAVPVP